MRLLRSRIALVIVGGVRAPWSEIVVDENASTTKCRGDCPTLLADKPGTRPVVGVCQETSRANAREAGVERVCVYLPQG